jgi:leucyl/phenylalanyl-tRNA--protein transferase
VLYPHETHIEKNLRRLIRQGRYAITFDRDFAAVMRACAEPRSGKTPLTWITPKMMRAFWALHEQGHAHSVEIWDRDSRLVGGLYGLAAGGVFFGESQFSFVRDASKMAVAALHCHLAHWGFGLRDAKWQTEHLASLGFREIPRAEFLRELEAHAWKDGRVGRWSVDPTLDLAAWRTGR